MPEAAIPRKGYVCIKNVTATQDVKPAGRARVCGQNASVMASVCRPQYKTEQSGHREVREHHGPSGASVDTHWEPSTRRRGYSLFSRAGRTSMTAVPKVGKSQKAET